MRIAPLIMFFCLSFLSGISKIDVVCVPSTPRSNHVTTKIIFPRPYENKRKTGVNVQLRLAGFPLGVATQNERAKKIYNHPDGQSIHIVIDNHPYLVYNQSFEDSFDGNNAFYDKIISFPIPFHLSPGMHVIRAFPTRSYGESMKENACFSTAIFYFQDRKKNDVLNIDLQKPYLTYNEPQGKYPLKKGTPILIDFLLSNCDLSPDGYKVQLSIDGKKIKMLTSYAPYYLYGLDQGKHTVKLELLDSDSHIVPGFFNVTEREIKID